MSATFRMTWSQVYTRLQAAPNCRVWGVPRGGQIIAGLIGTAVDSPELADVIVDDIVDSGATRERLVKYYGKPFWALVDKTAGADRDLGWVQFPWEEEPDDAGANVTRLLQVIGENPNRDGLKDTPRRVVKALREMTVGYRMDPGEILGRVFAEHHDEIITLDNIEFVSLCEHHMMAFMGRVHIGYVPDPERGIVGISKLARLVDCFARRLQVQERMTKEIATAIAEHLKPLGVGVVVEARHSCVCARGVGKQSSVMRTSSMMGVFRSDQAARAEFLRLIERGPL